MAVGDVGIVFQQAVDYLAKFQTHVLDVNWIQNVWDGDMCELDCLPAEFQDIHHATDWTDVYQHCCSAIREAFGFSPENGDNSRELNDDALFWLAVVQSNISVKGIIILANYFIRRGNNRNSSFGDRQTALNAASVYLILNCLPGSKAYRLFHPVVYESALEVLKKCSDLLIDLSKNGMSINKQTRNRRTKRRLSASNSLAPKKRKGAESRKNARKIHLDDDSEEKGDSNSENETSQSEALLFSVQEVNLLRESSVNFLNDLLLYLGYFPLKAYPHSLEHTIQCICEMLKVIPSASDHSCKSHLDLGYKCIKALCGQTHGCSKTTFSTVMKYFLKCIFCQESRIFVTLTSRLIEELPNADALPGACTLIKQLCIKVPERADARTKVSSVVHTIMNQFPPAVFADMIKWLLMYMHNVKVTYRLFGLEVISLLLGHLPETASVENISQSILKYLSDSCLLEAVIGRCSDSAATVRAKALNILASCIGSNISTVHEVMLSMFTSSNVQNTGHSAPRWSSADKGGETRNHGETNSKNERENILHEDTVNFSSRGCEVEKTPSDPKTLNTPSSPRPLAAVEATNLLRCRALDKKVHVRKSAVQVLQSVMEVNEECLSSENINALQNQCRDPSVLVRKQALQSLTGILLSRPLNSELQLAWLKGKFS